MKIKRYDLVRYCGMPCRVMDINHDDGDVKISLYGWVNLSSLTLIESVDVPIFNIGDEVLINPIDDDEYEEYAADWVEEMDDLIGTTSKVDKFDTYEQTYRLENGYWFCPYHLEKINDYDMI